MAAECCLFLHRPIIDAMLLEKFTQHQLHNTVNVALAYVRQCVTRVSSTLTDLTNLFTNVYLENPCSLIFQVCIVEGYVQLVVNLCVFLYFLPQYIGCLCTALFVLQMAAQSLWLSAPYVCSKHCPSHAHSLVHRKPDFRHLQFFLHNNLQEHLTSSAQCVETSGMEHHSGT